MLSPPTSLRVRVAENEVGVAVVVAQLALVLAQAPAEGGARQLVARPLRLPRRQVLAAQRPSSAQAA